MNPPSQRLPPTGRVYVVGSINEDLVLQVETIPTPGQTVLGWDARRSAGGKGANQAVAAARAGAAVHMIGTVGSDDAADRLHRALRDEDIDTTGINRVPEPTGMAVVTVSADAENAIVVTTGANAHCSAAHVWDRLSPSAIDPGADRLRPEDVVVTQGEIPASAILAAAAAAAEAGAKLVINLAPAIEVDLTGLAITVLVVNEHEANDLAARENLPHGDLGTTASALARHFSTYIVLTMGARGVHIAHPAVGHDAEGLHHVPAAPVRNVIDTTGAGDAFVGAFAASLALGCPLDIAARWGAVAGAATVEAHGAQGARTSRAFNYEALAVDGDTPTGERSERP